MRADNKKVWKQPVINRIDIKRTLAGGGSNADSTSAGQP